MGEKKATNGETSVSPYGGTLNDSLSGFFSFIGIRILTIRGVMLPPAGGIQNSTEVLLQRLKGDFHRRAEENEGVEVGGGA